MATVETHPDSNLEAALKAGEKIGEGLIEGIVAMKGFAIETALPWLYHHFIYDPHYQGSTRRKPDKVAFRDSNHYFRSQTWFGTH